MQKLNALQVRQSLGKVLKALKRNGEPILIEKDRRPAAVLISVEDYQRRFVDQAADTARRQIVASIRDAQLAGTSSAEVLVRELRGPFALIVVDASVAIKWFRADNEPHRDVALEVLDAIRDDPRSFAVPELFFNEVLAVLLRFADLSVSDCQAYVAALEQLGLIRIGNGHELLALAIILARDWRLTGYDAVYAATAKLTEGRWLTADAKAMKRVKEPQLIYLLDHFVA